MTQDDNSGQIFFFVSDMTPLLPWREKMCTRCGEVYSLATDFHLIKVPYPRVPYHSWCRLCISKENRRRHDSRMSSRRIKRGDLKPTDVFDLHIRVTGEQMRSWQIGQIDRFFRGFVILSEFLNEQT